MGRASQLVTDFSDDHRCICILFNVQGCSQILRYVMDFCEIYGVYGYNIVSCRLRNPDKGYKLGRVPIRNISDSGAGYSLQVLPRIGLRLSGCGLSTSPVPRGFCRFGDPSRTQCGYPAHGVGRVDVVFSHAAFLFGILFLLVILYSCG